MPVLKATMETAFYDDTPAYEHEDCEIRIDGDDITVSYEDEENGYVIYSGKDHGCGHFILKCEQLSAKATLHQIEDSKFLEGSWIEEGTRGFWKINLPSVEEKF